MERNDVDGGKKRAGAKDFSLAAQIFAAAWIAVWSAVKFGKAATSGMLAELGIADVIFSAFAIAACFSPVYFSIIMDKIKSIRFGDGK